MLITKTNPVGIDASLQRLQTSIHTGLVNVFGTNGSWDAYRSYGRCYRNASDNGFIAENYEGNNEYREVYWDDTLDMISFFGVAPSVSFDMAQKTTVHLVIFANLYKLYPNTDHRADEELHKVFLGLVGRSAFGFTYLGYDTTLEKVLAEYPGSRRDNRLKHVDMHPVHCFRMNFEATYQINQC